MAASEMRWLATGVVLAAIVPSLVMGQSAGEVERCFQNPAACAVGSASPPSQAPSRVPPRPTAAPDYASVLQAPEADRRKIQESLRTLDKYKGPIDGNLQSEATAKAIGDWQKGHNSAATGKLTPAEAKALNDEAARVPIRRIDPGSQQAAGAPTPLAPPSATSNAEALKILNSRIAERRKAAEPKANAATEHLVRDLRAYAAADGKGDAGDQFPDFAKWYAEAKAAGRTMEEVRPVIDDYGDAKEGAAATVEVNLTSKKGGDAASQCLVFAWVEGTPRRNAQTFSCDEVAGVEKWKTDQGLNSAWR